MDGGLCHCTGDRDQDHPQEKECKNANWFSEETLQIAVKRREAKKEKRKGISMAIYCHPAYLTYMQSIS